MHNFNQCTSVIHCRLDQNQSRSKMHVRRLYVLGMSPHDSGGNGMRRFQINYLTNPQNLLLFVTMYELQ
jgi:hypothetical protein